MGWWFQGFFSDGDAAVMSAALDRWPFCTGKRITSPFYGFGVRTPDPEREADSDEKCEALLELIFGVESGLQLFSREWPEPLFVWVHADRTGGTCFYSGYVTQSGEVLLRIESSGPGREPLQRLLAPLGIRLRNGHFEPFVRGYWNWGLAVREH